MLNQFSRTELLYGKEAMERLANARVAIFGLGGVGGYTAEALARSGVGTFDLIDDDKVCLTNLNRQIIATRKTVGKQKVEVMRDRILEINPHARIHLHNCFYLPDQRDLIDFASCTYVVDAVDTVTAKIDIVMAAKEAGVPVISAMGAGNKIHPELFEVADIYETSVCPLAKVMRRELKKRKVDSLKVVYSKEKARTPIEDMSISCKAHCVCPPGVQRKCTDRRAIPGSTAFTPSVMGLIMAGEIVNDIALGEENRRKRSEKIINFFSVTSGGMYMSTIIICAILVVICFGIRSSMKRVSNGCCGTGDDVKKVKAEDTDVSHYPYHFEVEVEGMTHAVSAKESGECF